MVPRKSVNPKQAVSLRPLTGMVPGERETVMKTMKFSPPYGENPLSHGLRRASSPERGSLVQSNGSCKSSPFRGSWRAAPERVLRGEVEIWYKDFDGMAKKFLSPYGDGTSSKSDSNSLCRVFAPLRGWYQLWTEDLWQQWIFAPLRGWYA